MNPEPLEPDQPVSGLGELEDHVSDDFLRSIRNSIDRRQTSGQLVSFGLKTPLLLLREFLGILDAPPPVLPKDKNRWK